MGIWPTQKPPEAAPDADFALLVRIARRDPAALHDAYQRHAPPVYAMACQLCGAETAAEIVRDVFIALWTTPDRFEPGEGVLRACLMAVAHRRAVETLRNVPRKGTGTEPAERSQVSHASHLVVDSADGVAAHLPSAERAAVLMTYVAGYTYREVAALLGEPEGAIRTWVRSGLVRLRALADSAEASTIGPPPYSSS